MEGTSSPFSTHRNWEEKGGGLGGLVGWGLAADEEEEDVVGLEREEARTVYCTYKGGGEGTPREIRGNQIASETWVAGQEEAELLGGINEVAQKYVSTWYRILPNPCYGRTN